MANSTNSDADIKIKATLDSSEVQTGLQKIGQDASASIDAAAQSGNKLAKSLDDVGKSAKISAQQIGQMSLAMASMAFDLASSVAESKGHISLAGYLKSTATGAAAGFAATAPALAMGPGGIPVVVAGTVGGGAVGAGKEYYRQDKMAKDDAQKLADLEQGNEKALASFEELRGAAEESAAFYSKIADESMSASEKQAALAERIKDFGEVAADLKAQLQSDDLQRDGKGFAETMRDYAQALKQVDAATAAGRAIGKDLGKAGATDGRADSLSDALTRIGGGIAGGGAGGMSDLASIQREGLGIARDQLSVLQSIKEEGLGTWG